MMQKVFLNNSENIDSSPKVFVADVAPFRQRYMDY